MSHTIINIRNSKRDFKPDCDRKFVKVSTPLSYQFMQSKREGYETRLYYEYQNTQTLGGLTFYLTLTYNSTAMPYFYGVPCPDYNNLRFLLHDSRFTEKIHSLGYQYKYFVGTELGEGKGFRGFHNNPHYHVLFFVTPIEGVTPSIDLTYLPEEFLYAVRTYWQGKDDKGKLLDYKTARFGHVQEGSEGIVVKDGRATMYCAKYCCKDASMKADEQLIRSRVYIEAREKFPNLEEHELQDFVNSEMSIYRKRYSPKVRVSNGVGLSGINAIVERENRPYIPLPKKNGEVKFRPIGLYYFRKVYMDWNKDKNSPTYKSYYLNDKGVDLRMRQLDSNICKSVTLASNAILAMLGNDIPASLSNILRYYGFTRTDYELLLGYATHNTPTNYLENITPSPLLDYSVFTTVYKSLSYYVKKHSSNDDYTLSNNLFEDNPSMDKPLDMYCDYMRTLDKKSELQEVFSSEHYHIVPYELHPYFLPYYRLFRCIDYIILYYQDKNDAVQNKEFVEKRRREISRLVEKFGERTYLAD